MKICFFPLLLLAATATLVAATLPFVEEFENNDRGWVTGKENPKLIETIKEGWFTCENLNPNIGNQNWSSLPFDFDKSQDFEILLRVKVIEGTPTGTHTGIVWDGNGTHKRFFEISANGNYSINSMEKDAWVLTRNEIPTKLIRKTEDNELAIRRIGSRVYYFINGVAVDAGQFSEMQGQTIGLETYAGCTNSFDRLVVRHLDGPPEKRAVEARKYEAEARAAYLAAGPAAKEFGETFADNSRNWPFMTEGKTWTSKISDGVLEWQNRDADGSHSTWLPLPINDAGNYDLSVKIRYVAGKKNLPIGIQWGSTAKEDNALQLNISGDIDWTLGERVGNAYRDILPWRESSLIKSGQFNELRVRQLGHTLFIYINGRVVADVPARLLTGDRVRLIISHEMTAAFDDLKLSYTPLTEAQTEAETAKIVAELKRAHGQKGLGAVYSVAHQQDLASAQSKADMQRLDDAAAGALKDADFRHLLKIQEKFEGKTVLSLYGSWGRPVTIFDNPSGPSYVYYNYKLIGRTNYYYEFAIIKRGPTQKDWTINNVSLEKRRRNDPQ